LSQRHRRAQLAAISAGLAAAALFAGPAATWALDVTGAAGSAGSATTQVTGAVQGAVETTQQTVATTVTTVESTAQTTVQTTTQAAQPVVNQVQASAPAAPAAPSTPAPKPAAQPTSRPSAATKNVSRHTAGAVQAIRTPAETAARSLRESAAAPERAPSRRSLEVSPVRQSSSASAPTSPATSPVAPQCDTGGLVQLLGPLLAVAPPVGALLTAVCDAGNGLLAPPQAGTGREAVLPLASPAGALAALAAGAVRAYTRGAGSVERRRGSDRYPARAPGGGGDPLAGAASSTRPPTTGRNVPAFGRGSFAAALAAVHNRHSAPAPLPAPAGRHSHAGLFGTSITGTELVFAILVLDWAILVALVMWRVSRRRPVLRWAFAWRARRDRRVAPSTPGRLAALFSIVR